MTPTNILVSSAGRRVSLIGCLRDSIKRAGIDGGVLTVDCGSAAPATFVSDITLRVPRCTDPSYLDQLLTFCENNRVKLLIPTIDTELSVYAEASGRFADRGITVCISDPATIHICCDKSATHDWLDSNGFPTVRQANLQAVLLNPVDWPLPVIVKPYNGSASVGVRRIQTRLELEALAQTSPDRIVQEIAAGREFTINVYVSRSGRCVCAVPHWRMEIRAGEVSKGFTVKDRRLMDLGVAVAEALPGAYGPLNIQCFMDELGTVRIIEINARFGGGYPLTHQAGARFTDWLLDEVEGREISPCEDWTDDLAMLRYDDAVFVPGHRTRT